MNKTLEKIFVIVTDFITINLAWIVYYYYRVESGAYVMLSRPEFFLPMLVIYLYWLLLFASIGMYRPWFASSRFDELSKLFKTTFIGVFILFALIFFDDAGAKHQHHSLRYLIVIYWGILFVFVGGGRLFIRSLQRYLLIKGVGRRNTLLIGFNERSKEVADRLLKFKQLGLDPVGFIAVDKSNLGKEYKGIPVIGAIDEIPKIVKEKNIKETIIALLENDEETIMNIIAKFDSLGVSIKIVPDLYQIVTGQVRKSSVYEVPLMEINPQLMTEWERKLKRLMDIVVSLIILILSLPITIITAIFIKLESPGPVIFKQERVGLNGKIFKIYKFRSMINDAEKKTGPVWAGKNDPRITKVGKFIRKVRIDEIPQMVNVLKGEMSLVGPRPERPYFVEKFAKEIPFYKRRLLVKPGITGWAQVKHKYDESIEDVKTKLKYDLFYIENMSIRMDLKILFRTVFTVLLGKGHFEE